MRAILVYPPYPGVEVDGNSSGESEIGKEYTHISREYTINPKDYT